MSDTNVPLLENLMAQMEQMNASQAAMANKIETLTAENHELKQILTKNPNQAPVKPKIPADIFEVDGEKYRFRVAKFKVPARKGEKESTAQSCTAVDALTSPKLLALLVELESGVIAKVVE